MGKEESLISKTNIIAIIIFIGTVISLSVYYSSEFLLGKKPSNLHSNINQSPKELQSIDDEISKNLRAELEINPNSISALKSLSEHLWSKISQSNQEPSPGIILEILDTLSKLLQINPHDQMSLLMMANISFNQKVFDKSAEYYEKYLKLAPDDDDARASYSSTLTFLGKFAESLEQIQLVLNKNPKSFQANAYKAITLAQMGENPLAIEQGKLALSYAPSDEARKRFLSFLSSIEGFNQESSKANESKRDVIVSIVKSSTVSGPKFVKSNIANDEVLELYFKDFPMSQMPTVAKNVFFEKIKAGNQKDKFKRILFIDFVSNQIMERLDLNS